MPEWAVQEPAQRIGVLTAWMQDADVVVTPLTCRDQVMTGPSQAAERGGGDKLSLLVPMALWRTRSAMTKFAVESGETRAMQTDALC